MDDDALKPAIRHLLARRDGLAAVTGSTGATGAAGASRQGGASGTIASRFADGRRIGLVVQGGAMRGVFTAGALCGLEELGLRDCFDVAFGASGGAINIAYLLAGQVFYGTSIYYSDINNNAFIDFRRFVAGTAVDIDYCFDEVIGRRKRLDLERVLAHPTDFRILLTDAEESASIHVRQHEIASGPELLAALKASAAMPLVYRKRLEFRGRRVIDGAYLDPVPLDAAVADGCTDILVLLSRPLRWRPAPVQAWVRAWMRRSIGPRDAAAHDRAWLEGQRRLAATLARLQESVIELGDGRVVHLAIVALPGSLGLARYTRGRSRLVAAATEGARRVHTLCGADPETMRPHEAIRLVW